MNPKNPETVKKRDERLGLRLRIQERELIETAAAIEGRWISEFVRDAACAEAERVIRRNGK